MSSIHNTPLDAYFQQVESIILRRQDWVTGLLPASTAINAHGNYTDAWVRDNVYSILAAWGLALAYRRSPQQNNDGRCYLLEQSVVKLMRGLLTAMMRQSAKVERFKHTQNPMDALHAKYDTKTGLSVVGDDEWGHLQLDATSLYLLMLAQMTASGLRIVFTIDEVNFVQNLVHYISRTYRTPDYGIWERGNKSNHGIAELNASSVGMAKAALEALSGFNLFGVAGGQASVIHVISDDIARARITLEALLPRESMSKEVDAALLSITGFPAFAVDKPSLRQRTEDLIQEKLAGNYGCKRFLLDGHQTLLEDSKRLHYYPHELKQFMAIECEWPLFFCYFLLNYLFSGNEQAAYNKRQQLEKMRVNDGGQQLLPELYRVPLSHIEAEKAKPHSQPREANENIPLVWAQSLFILGSLLQDKLLTRDDIDPLKRYQTQQNAGRCTIHIALLAKDDGVQTALAKLGIATQTLAEIAPIQCRDASELADAFTHVGRNDRIGLTGRPLRQLRILATSKLYILSGEPLIFLPQCLNQKGFYLALDNRLLIQRLHLELAYVHQHWDRTDQPLIVMTIKHNHLAKQHRAELLEFIASLQQGYLDGIPVQLGNLTELCSRACHEKIDYLHDFQFSMSTGHDAERPFFEVIPFSKAATAPLDSSVLEQLKSHSDQQLQQHLTNNENVYFQLEVLSLLAQRHDLQYRLQCFVKPFDVTVADLLAEVYERAGDLHAWFIVRQCAGLLGKYDINLEQAATDILVRQHLLSLADVYQRRTTLTRPTDSSEILYILQHYNAHKLSEQIIYQELVIYLGMLIKAQPALFVGMHTLRVGHILHLLLIKQQESLALDAQQAFDSLLFLSPYALSNKVREALMDVRTWPIVWQPQTIVSEGEVATEEKEGAVNGGDEHCYALREWLGYLGRDQPVVFSSIWLLLHHCQGLMIGDKISTKRCLESESILSQMTSGEQSFKVQVTHLLNKIQSAVIRQITIEVLYALAVIVKHQSSLFFKGMIATDTIIQSAIEHYGRAQQGALKDQSTEALAHIFVSFYRLPPPQLAVYIQLAFYEMLTESSQPLPQS